MRKQARYLVGLNSGHDATATVLDPEGRVVAAIGEERLSRVKFDMGFPYRALDESLRVAGIKKDEVGAVALATRRLIFAGTPEYNALYFGPRGRKRPADYFNNSRLKPKARLLFDLFMGNLTAARRGFSTSDFLRESEAMTLDRQKEALAEVGLGHAEAASYEHHLCHAASAAYLSGKPDGLVITIDGAGDGLCASAHSWKGSRLVRLSGAADLVSPGRFLPLTGRVSLWFLEPGVILADALLLKFVMSAPFLQGAGFVGISWKRALVASLLGNASSFFVGVIGSGAPWEVHEIAWM